MKKLMIIFSIFVVTMIIGNNEIKAEQNKFIFVNFGKSLDNLNSNFFSLDKYISARRGGGFGGIRTRRSTSTRSRSSSSRTAAARPSNPTKSPSFGGKRISSAQAKSRYGTPRKVESFQGKNAAGTPMNYNIHHYGGFSNSLMTGYMMGNMAWWMMAPSMLYSRPVYVEKEDGSIDVYPPTFDWGRLFIMILVIGLIVYVIRGMLRAKKLARGDTYSHSSFG
jgi:hypothetical protein